MTTFVVTPADDPQFIANQLTTGDELMFQEGLHYGQITIPCDGVLIWGEPGAILDGTQVINSGWQLAKNSDGFGNLDGSGTWRAAAPDWVWMLLDAEGNTIFRIDNDYVGVKEPNNFYMSAFEAMAVPNGARPPVDYGYDWWNGIEALSAWSGGYIYCRYRDGRRPESMRWSGGHNDHREPPTEDGSVIYMRGRRNITISGLHVRGCVDGIAVRDSTGVRIEECKFTSFDFGTRVHGDCDDVKVVRSDFNSKLYGTTIHTPISKICLTPVYPPEREIAWRQYTMGKFFHDESDSTHLAALAIYNGWDDATGTVYRPKRIEFAYNHVSCGQFGTDLFGGDGIDIHHNHVHNMIDIPFQRQDGARNIKIHDNLTHEIGYELLRWHKPEQEAGDNYIYNNRASDIAQVGDFMAFTGYASPTPVSKLRLWIYHNSLAGGNSTAQIAGVSSMPDVNWINNAMPLGLDGPRGVFANNYTGAAIWNTDQVEKDFEIPDGHAAKEGGIDISKQFVVNGKTYGPLPGFEPGYFTGSAPDQGWIAREEDPVTENAEMTTPTPGTVLPGSEVNFSWSPGSGVSEYWLDIGTAPIDEQGGDILSESTGLEIDADVVGIPTDGQPIYVVLWSKIGGSWYSMPYEYTAASGDNPDPPNPGGEYVLAFVPAMVPKDCVFPIADIQQFNKKLNTQLRRKHVPDSRRTDRSHP